MLELTTYTELEIAHRLLTSYAQRCRHLHGHRYEVEISVTGKHEFLNKDGMIVDFKRLKEVVKTVLDDQWDHGACFNAEDPIGQAMLQDAENSRLHIVDANPTLEWMVCHWAKELQAAFDYTKLDLKLVRLTASETARNTVTWTPDGTKVTGDPGPLEIELPDEYKNDREIERDARVERPKCEMNEAVPRKPLIAEYPSRSDMVHNLSNETGVDIDTCRNVLAGCHWNYAQALKKIEYLRRKGVLGCKLAPASECQLKERPKTEVDHIEVPVECAKPEDELREDEDAYLVSYWPVGYPQPVSGVFASSMRGVSLVRTLQAAIDEKHPGGATLISFNRVPR